MIIMLKMLLAVESAFSSRLSRMNRARFDSGGHFLNRQILYAYVREYSVFTVKSPGDGVSKEKQIFTC